MEEQVARCLASWQASHSKMCKTQYTHGPGLSMAEGDPIADQTAEETTLNMEERDPGPSQQ